MKIALNGQQLAATHSLSEILDVFEAHGVKAIELWPANFSGTSGTPEDLERYETKDVNAAAQLLKARGFEVACVTLEELERRSVHHQLDVDVLGSALGFDVLVDECEGVFGDVRVLAVHMVDDLDLVLSIRCGGVVLA